MHVQIVECCEDRLDVGKHPNTEPVVVQVLVKGSCCSVMAVPIAYRDDKMIGRLGIQKLELLNEVVTVPLSEVVLDEKCLGTV